MQTLKHLFSKNQILLTLVGLICAYFIGHLVVSVLYNHILPFVSMFGQDETAGFLALATAIPATLKLKEVKELKPLPFEVSTVKTKKDTDAYLILFKGENLKESDIFRKLATVADLGPFSWPSKGSKKDGIYALGLMVNPVSEKFIKGYNNLTYQKAEKLAEESKVIREAAKEAKKAAKGTAKVSTPNNTVNAVNAKIAALNDMHAKGLITPIQLAELISKI